MAKWKKEKIVHEIFGTEIGDWWAIVEPTGDGRWAWQIGHRSSGIAHRYGTADTESAAKREAETAIGDAQR